MKLLIIFIFLTLLKIQTIISTSTLSSDTVYINFFGGYESSDCSGEVTTPGWSFAIINNSGCYTTNYGTESVSWSMNITESGEISVSLDYEGCYVSENTYSKVFKLECVQIPDFMANNMVSYGLVSITKQPTLALQSVIINQMYDYNCEIPYIYQSFPVGYSDESAGYTQTYTCNYNNQALLTSCVGKSCSTEILETTCNVHGQAVYCQ